jgi:hypothetical protein
MGEKEIEYRVLQENWKQRKSLESLRIGGKIILS